MFSVGKKETTPYIYAFICKVGKYGTDILMNWSPYSNLFCAAMKNWTDNFSLSFCNASKCYEGPWPILRQSTISIPPENVSKLEVFWRFQGVLKCSMDLNGLKTYTRALTSSKRFLKTFFNFIYLRLFFFVISCQWKKGLTELSEKCLCRNSVVISERDTEESYLGV